MWGPGLVLEVGTTRNKAPSLPRWDLGLPRRTQGLGCSARGSEKSSPEEPCKTPYLGFRDLDAVGQISILDRFRGLAGWRHLNVGAGAVWELDFFCDVIWTHTQRKQMESAG